ncbi:hypothetical protein Amsp01_056350 [Amycolatopsis sp. NBRC 101858]|uniref:tetratricopeptide repeat protein n=1 Tax=Amycolatopsis sp. NBRC 101858 TaxID=3032200 RepID=UPI0024A3E4B0|nr:tetratricopeptide repeat protein [Amycolatopsis sp. NBRC 101858]GLY39611.1 hypothetical protein Amsp01_056350 [Amycolatopsis sp. NBRC 101858]
MRVQRWGRRGWVVFTLAAATAVVAVPVVLSAVGVKNSWWAGVAAAAAAIAAAFVKVPADRYQRLAARRDEGDLSVLDGCLATSRGDLPQVRQILDPRRLGVHPAAQLAAPDHGGGTVETMPVYVPRDVDEQVRARVARGGFVLLVGDSTAGKSRTAFEAIVATVPDHVLVAPRDRLAVKAALDWATRAGNCVIWLNDLEHYLGAEGVTREMLSRLLSTTRHIVVMATIRARELARFADHADGDEATRQTFRAAREVLDLVDEEVRLERSLSTTEHDRAADRSWDLRIADAVRHSGDYGLAEYLAAGPELLREWRNGWDVGTNPRGAALVTAAIDVRRAGMQPPLPGRLLEELAEQYLKRRGGDRLRPEQLDAAWGWALKARRATTSLMSGSAKAGYDVFDYLVDVLQRDTTPDSYVPEPTLNAAIDFADGVEALTIGATARMQGYYTVALRACSQATQWHNDKHGLEHPNALISRGNLATTLSELGRLDEAEREHRVVFEASARVLGPEHPNTLISRNNLAHALRALGRLDEAEREHRAELEASARVLGPEHPDTLISRNNLATTLRALGRLDEAEREHRAELEASARVLGPEHPNTLTSRNNLALTLRALGRLDEAEREHRAVFEASARVLGPEHPNTLTGRNNLATTLSELGRLDEAEREHRAVLETRTRVLGPEHPDTLTSRNNLATTLRALGRLDEAEREHRAVLETRTRVLGPKHPNTLTSRNNLATTLNALGRLDEAEREHRAVLETRTRVLGPKHPNTLTSRNNLAMTLRELSDET